MDSHSHPHLILDYFLKLAHKTQVQRILSCLPVCGYRKIDSSWSACLYLEHLSCKTAVDSTRLHISFISCFYINLASKATFMQVTGH